MPLHSVPFPSPVVPAVQGKPAQPRQERGMAFHDKRHVRGVCVLEQRCSEWTEGQTVGGGEQKENTQTPLVVFYIASL